MICSKCNQEIRLNELCTIDKDVAAHQVCPVEKKAQDAEDKLYQKHYRAIQMLCDMYKCVTNIIALEKIQYDKLVGDDSDRYVPLCRSQNDYEYDMWSPHSYNSIDEIIEEIEDDLDTEFDYCIIDLKDLKRINVDYSVKVFIPNSEESK